MSEPAEALGMAGLVVVRQELALVATAFRAPLLRMVDQFNREGCVPWPNCAQKHRGLKLRLRRNGLASELLRNRPFSLTWPSSIPVDRVGIERGNREESAGEPQHRCKERRYRGHVACAAAARAVAYSARRGRASGAWATRHSHGARDWLPAPSIALRFCSSVRLGIRGLLAGPIWSNNLFVPPASTSAALKEARFESDFRYAFKLIREHEHAIVMHALTETIASSLSRESAISHIDASPRLAMSH